MICLLYVAICKRRFFMLKNRDRKIAFTVKRIVFDALFAAMFFALSLIAVEIAGVKITLVSLATVVCAMMYGTVDAVIVGLLGAFLEQLIKYGITATTLLWIMPAGIRALIIGLGARSLGSKMTIDTVISDRKPYVYFAVCILAGVATSLSNTLVYYVDAKLYGYYNYALIFGALGVRLFTGVLSSLVTAVMAIPILAALKKARIAPER